MAYVGIPVHKKQSQICTFAEAGAILHQRIETQRERFAAVLGAHPPVRPWASSATRRRLGRGDWLRYLGLDSSANTTRHQSCGV